MRYEIDSNGLLIVPDAMTLTCLDISWRREIKTLPPLPAATWVDAVGCTGLTTLDLPAATTVDANGCTGLTTLDLPAATWVDANGCTGLTTLDLPAATTVYAGGCTGLTTLDLPAATWVYANGCTGLRVLTCPKLPPAPVIADLAARVAAAVGDGQHLDMSDWHCGTSHCHAGWITTIAGEAGAALEAASNTATAAALICIASQPHLGVPDFYCKDDAALAEIKARAA